MSIALTHCADALSVRPGQAGANELAAVAGSTLYGDVWDGQISIVDLATKSVIKNIATPGGNAAVCWLGDAARYVVTGGDDAAVHVWDSQAQKPSAAAASVDVMASETDEEAAAKQSQQPLLSLIGHSDCISALSSSPFSVRHVLSASWDRTIRLWDIENVESVSVFRGHLQQVWNVAWQCSQGGDVSNNTFISSSRDGRVMLWDRRQPGVQAEISLGFPLSALAWSSTQSTQFVAGSDVGQLFFCDVRQLLKPVSSYGEKDNLGEMVRSVSFAPVSNADGSSTLAIASADRTVTLQNITAAGEFSAKRLYRSHTDTVTGVAWTSAGLASCSWDKTLALGPVE